LNLNNFDGVGAGRHANRRQRVPHGRGNARTRSRSTIAPTLLKPQTLGFDMIQAPDSRNSRAAERCCARSIPPRIERSGDSSISPLIDGRLKTATPVVTKATKKSSMPREDARSRETWISRLRSMREELCRACRTRSCCFPERRFPLAGRSGARRARVTVFDD